MIVINTKVLSKARQAYELQFADDIDLPEAFTRDIRKPQVQEWDHFYELVEEHKLSEGQIDALEMAIEVMQ